MIVTAGSDDKCAAALRLGADHAINHRTQDFAQQALSAVRATDVLARWGGEEFLLILPDTEPQAAALVLERMRTRIAAHAFSSGESPLKISFSGGLTVARKGEAIAATIARADAALYAAKAAGRDRIVNV